MNQQGVNESKENSSPSHGRSDIRANVQLLLDKAEQERKTNLKDAIKTLEEAARQIPKLHEEEKQNKQSVMNTAQNINDLEAIYFYKRGNISYEIDNYQDAELSYREVEKRFPPNHKLYKALGDALRKQGQHQKAIGFYDSGIDMFDEQIGSNPKDKAALLNSKGLALLEFEKQYDAADKCFDEALELASENPLYHCNKGRALFTKNPKELSFLKYFEKACQLTQTENFKVEGLTKANISFINKTLKELINLLPDLKQIHLTKQDSVITDRENNYVKEILTGMIESKAIANSNATAVNQILDTKKKLQELLKQPDFSEFYDGFLYTLRQSYSTAVIVNSGTFSIDTTGDPAVNGLKGLISIIPLVGSRISDGIEQVGDFIKTPQVTNAAANVAKFAKDLQDFNAIAQDAVVAIMTARQEKIKSLKGVDIQMFSAWKERFKKLFDKFKQAEEYIYVSRINTTMGKLGYQTAVELVSKFIANGKIYEGETAITLPQNSEIKMQRLIKAGLDLLDKGIDKGVEEEEDNSVKRIVVDKDIKKKAQPPTTGGDENNSVKPVVADKDIKKTETSPTTTRGDENNSVKHNSVKPVVADKDIKKTDKPPTTGGDENHVHGKNKQSCGCKIF